MSLPLEMRLRCTQEAPRGPNLLLPDTTVIERPGWYQLLTPPTRSAHVNKVIYSALEEGEVEGRIDETSAVCRAHGLPVKWSTGPWTRPQDMDERLRRRGFSEWEVRGMAVDPAL